MARFRLYLLVAAFDQWRLSNPRRHPLLTEHVERWALFAFLVLLTYPLVLWPLYLFLYAVRTAHAGNAAAETLLMSEGIRVSMVLGMAAMIAASMVLTGLAKAVADKFDGRHWTLLVLGVMAGGLVFYIGYTTAVITAVLGFARGDNAVFACFVIIWSAAIARVCSVLLDRAGDSWAIRFGRSLP